MINTWLEAMGDDNPRFRDGGEAPPAMAQVWTMPGLRPQARPPDDPLHAMMELLDEAGYTAVLGTNCEQTYERYLARRRASSGSPPGSSRSSGPKQTGVGEGYFVTTRNIWSSGDETGRDDAVPGAQVHAEGAPTDVTRPPDGQPRHAVLLGGHRGRASCGSRSATPAARCATRPARRARLRRAATAATSSPPGAARSSPTSCTAHPPVPGKELPIVLALIDLDEGVRMVGEVVDVARRRGARDRDAAAASTSTGSTTT